MTIIYIDPNGKSMRMESDYNPVIEIPVLFRFYKIFDSLSVFINPSQDQIKKMNKNKKNHPDQFEYYMTSMVLNGSPDNMENWKLQRISGAPNEILARYPNYWKSAFENWYGKYVLGNRSIYGNHSTLGDTFYFADRNISNVSNVCIYAFTKCDIDYETLSNVLIFKMGK